MIDQFNEKYAFLSNFYEAPVTFDELTYGSSEAAYQAQKTLNKEARKAFTEISPALSKKLGRVLMLRPDWERVKVSLMHEICLAKFTQNTELGKMLIATGNEELIEGNHWNDTFWGMCDGVGENHLGKILMEVRNALK